MTNNRLDAIRAQMKQPERGESRPNNYYPFWQMENGERAVIRFLPDKDESNLLGFMVEKSMHPLIVNGEKKNMPCLKMYDEECPICDVSKAFYKEKDEENGKKYWRKKQHIAQAIIVEDPLPADKDTGETHEGNVRFLALGYQLYNAIKEAFESGELDDVPFAYEGGCNFIIKKSEQGKYSTYAVGSQFARKSTDLTQDEIAIAEDQMIELATLLPPKPDVTNMEAVLEAALNGSAYNEESSNSEPADSTATETATADTTTTDASSEELDDDTEKLLAEIRNRRKAS